MKVVYVSKGIVEVLSDGEILYYSPVEFKKKYHKSPKVGMIL